MKNDARLWGLYALLIGANLAAWLWAWAAFAQRPSLLGLALLAWVRSALVTVFTRVIAAPATILL